MGRRRSRRFTSLFVLSVRVNLGWREGRQGDLTDIKYFRLDFSKIECSIHATIMLFFCIRVVWLYLFSSDCQYIYIYSLSISFRVKITIFFGGLQIVNQWSNGIEYRLYIWMDFDILDSGHSISFIPLVTKRKVQAARPRLLVTQYIASAPSAHHTDWHARLPQRHLLLLVAPLLVVIDLPVTHVNLARAGFVSAIPARPMVI